MIAQMTIQNIILISNRYLENLTADQLYIVLKIKIFNRACEYHILPRIFLGTPEDSNQNHLSFFSYVIWFFLRYVVFLFFLKRQVLIIWHLVAYIARKLVKKHYRLYSVTISNFLLWNKIWDYDNFLNIYFC